MSIHIKNLNHTYDVGSPFAQDAIRNIDLDINDGEFVAVIGHTGSGKSTLVQHLNGILKPSEVEEMVVEGIDLTQKKPSYKALRKAVGMVFQYPEYQLFEQTVFDDIAFGPKNMGFTEEETEAAVKESMALVGLDESFCELSPFELSGGCKRRAAIAGVLAMRPHVLALDEPIAGLDPKGKKEIIQTVIEYHKKYNATIIMISHNMDDIVSIADRVIVMHRGEKALDGTPNEVFAQREKIKQLGLELPTVCELAERLNARGAHIPLSVCRAEELIEYFTVGVRK